MGVVKAAVADFVMTFIAIFCVSTIGVLTYIIGSAFGIAPGLASLSITIVIVFLLFLMLSVIAEALGGAAFNPAGTAAFYAAGVGNDSLFSVAARFPAQILYSMGAVKAAVGDFVLTLMWVFCSSTLGIFTYLIATAFGIAQGMVSLFITTVLLFMLFFVFGIIGDALGGAAFNPAGTAAFYAAGVGKDSLFTVATRFPAQAAGAVAGAVAILEVIPTQYKHMLGGPSLKVDLHNGAIAEGILTFVMTFLVFIIVLKGPKSALLKNWLLAMSTVTMVVAGSKYTGPSMNPANAFGWAYINNMHNTWEQFYVYWICPFVGAILAAWTFRAVFPAPAKKKKPQKKKRN